MIVSSRVVATGMRRLDSGYYGKKKINNNCEVSVLIIARMGLNIEGRTSLEVKVRGRLGGSGS